MKSKKIIPLFLFFFLFFVFSCGDPSNSSDNQSLSGGENEETVTLSFYYTLYNPKTNELIERYDQKPSQIAEVSETKSYDYNSYVDLFAYPKDGYTFIGWFSKAQKLSDAKDFKYMLWDEDVLVEAAFAYTTYDMNVWSNNSDFGKVMIREGNSQIFHDNQTLDKYYTENVTVVAYANNDTQFLGWYDNNNELVSNDSAYTFKMPSRDYSLEAKWDNFKITYDLDGGTNDDKNPKFYTKEMQNIELLEPKKDGYTFIGWKYNEEYITSIDTSKICHMNLQAIWKKIIVTSNNPFVGDVTELNGNYKPGDSVTISATEPKVIGYSFSGWYKDDELITKEYDYTFSAPAEDITYEARYDVIDELSDFVFFSTSNECIIAGLKDITIESISIPSVVTSIGDYAFQNYSDLKNVTIANGVISIGEYSFCDCVSLTSITIPDSVTSIGFGAFSGCTKLKSINIPNGVEKIEDYTYDGCISLESITIPNSVKSIGNHSFSGCMAENVSMPSFAIRYMNKHQFKNVVISSGTTIEDFSFQGCWYLTNIIISHSVEEIGKYAFNDCTSLTSITIPENVTSIGERAFGGCIRLVEIVNKSSLQFTLGSTDNGYVAYYAKQVITDEKDSKLTITDDGLYLYDDVDKCVIGYTGEDTEIIIPNYVTNISQSAFYNCSSLKNIEIPSSVASIGDNAFSHCTSLTSITIPNSVTSMSNSVFSDCSSLESITIGNGVTSIGIYAFAYCSSLKIITIPESVTSIGISAFRGCTSLTGITIPNSVASIGEYAFNNCTSLTSITIPNSVTSIGERAFDNYSEISLNAVYYVGTSSQYDYISIASNNDSLWAATKYFYSDEKPTDAGNYWHYVDGVVTIWE